MSLLCDHRENPPHLLIPTVDELKLSEKITAEFHFRIYYQEFYEDTKL